MPTLSAPAGSTEDTSNPTHLLATRIAFALAVLFFAFDPVDRPSADAMLRLDFFDASLIALRQHPSLQIRADGVLAAQHDLEAANWQRFCRQRGFRDSARAAGRWGRQGGQAGHDFADSAAGVEWWPH